MSESSFIEEQFPVSKLSKECYKERKSSQGQTITGLGKWWGRKPLTLVRAAILGCLLPATADKQGDRAAFLRLMGMDAEGLWHRRKKLSVRFVLDTLKERNAIAYEQALSMVLRSSSGTPRWDKSVPDATRARVERAAWDTLSYDEKIANCYRQEELENLSKEAWAAINEHCGTSAQDYPSFVEEVSQQRYGDVLSVGDCFAGGGSIPFEAARLGCEVVASDLNPIAGLLTWADIHLSGADEETRKRVQAFQQRAYDNVKKQIDALGIERAANGAQALSYLYCVEVVCPECGWRVPMIPSLVVGARAGKVRAVLRELPESRSYAVDIIETDAKGLAAAAQEGTVNDSGLVCPHCHRTTPIAALRHDRVAEDGTTVYGLRAWEKNEWEPRPEDVYQERLYAIRYERFIDEKHTERYYAAPDEHDVENERKVHDYVAAHFADWQKRGLVPSMAIDKGVETERLRRERGWCYWHQLFGPRQLLVLGMFVEAVQNEADIVSKSAGILGLNRCLERNAKLCMWDALRDGVSHTFYNQALNTLFNWGVRSLTALGTQWFLPLLGYPFTSNGSVSICDAREVQHPARLWLTDPPYADAVNYHELSEYFLAWDKSLLPSIFPDGYTDSKRALAVRGDAHFAQTMVEIYTNLAHHMPDDGMQVVMFTHSSPAVWAQLALILWQAGLSVTAAWNIVTETDSPGLKAGNYVKGTVLLVLRKRTGTDEAFLNEVYEDIEEEVAAQIESMRALDDQEEPNFSDPDYVLAAYAASLKVLTSYAAIDELDLDYELQHAIENPKGSQIVQIIEKAKDIAYGCIIPQGFDRQSWRSLTQAEKFYLKGLESEKRGDTKIATYQEFARGFGIAGYGQLMASEKANAARLKTPVECGERTFGDVPDFSHSLLRTLFAAIAAGVRADHDPRTARDYLKTELGSAYWEQRDLIRRLLAVLIDTRDIGNMKKHWAASADVADMLLALVANDGV